MSSRYTINKKKPGAKPGSKRTDFTDEDDSNLFTYLADRVPDSSDRGRSGNKIYQELVEMVSCHQMPGAYTPN